MDKEIRIKKVFFITPSYRKSKHNLMSESGYTQHNVITGNYIVNQLAENNENFSYFKGIIKKDY